VVDQRRDVVQPVGVRDRVVPAADLAVFLEGAMEVADLDIGLDDHFAVELAIDTDDPVHGRVLRAQTEVHRLGTAAGGAAFTEHELARGGAARFGGGGLAGGGAGPAGGWAGPGGRHASARARSAAGGG